MAGHKKKPGYRGRPLSDHAIHNAFARLIGAAGLDERYTPYTLRHTYCTMLLRSGIDIRTVQKRMGHARITTTQRYLHAIEVEDHPTDALPY